MLTKFIAWLVVALLLVSCEEKDSGYTIREVDSSARADVSNTTIDTTYVLPISEEEKENSAFTDLLEELSQQAIETAFDKIQEDLENDKASDAEWKFEHLKTRMEEENVRASKYKKRMDRLNVDIAVAKILSSEYGQLPEATGTDNIISASSTIEVTNETGYTLTVYYSGTDSKQVVLAPGESRPVRLKSGSYQVAASVSAASVLNYAGSQTLTGGMYSIRFYIETRSY